MPSFIHSLWYSFIILLLTLSYAIVDNERSTTWNFFMFSLRLGSSPFPGSPQRGGARVSGGEGMSMCRVRVRREGPSWCCCC